MGRIRTIKPEFWRHEGLSALPEFCHMLAAALLNYADDEGYFNANPRLIMAECFPLREPSVNVHCAIIELSNIGFVRVGLGADGRTYGHITKFTEHQRVNRPYPSKISVLSITWSDSLNVHGMINERSSPEKEKEWERERERVDDDDGAQAREIDVSPQPQTDREIILEAIGVNPVSGLTGKGGRMIGTAADMQFAQRWADLGLSLGEQCAVIRETMANKRDGPPSGFSYFDKPMAKLAAAKSAPPITPIHQPNQTTGGIHGNGNRYGNASRIGGDRFLDEIANVARSRPSSG